MRTYSSLDFSLVVLSLVLLNAASGLTKTVYVNSAKSLQSALINAQAADEIIVANDSYTGKFSITKNSGTSANPIILRREQRQKVILKGYDDFSDSTNVGFTVSRAYWIIEGLEIKDYLPGMVVKSCSAHHVEVRHNLVHNFGARGIDVSSSANTAEINGVSREFVPPLPLPSPLPMTPPTLQPAPTPAPAPTPGPPPVAKAPCSPSAPGTSGQTSLNNGRTYYVSGSGGGNGTSASSPMSFAQITGLSLKPGDNVLFKRGDVIYMTSAFHMKSSGTASNPITLGAYGSGAAPVIDGSRVPLNHHYGFNITGQSGIVIDGLELRNHGLPMAIRNSSDILVRNSIIHHAGAACNHIGHGSKNVTYENNTIHTCGLRSNGEGIYVGTDPGKKKPEDVVTNVVIRNNEIYKTGDEAVELKPGVRNAQVISNVIHDARIGIHASHWPGSSFNNHHIIQGNTIYNINLKGNSGRGQGGNALVVKTGADIVGNVIYNVVDAPGIHVYDNRDAGQTIRVHNNTVYNTEGGIKVGNGRIEVKNNSLSKPPAGNPTTAAGRPGSQNGGQSTGGCTNPP